VNLQANSNALTRDWAASGEVSLTVIPPPGVRVPRRFPSAVRMTRGAVSFRTSFKTSGYYRIEATGPHHSKGWTTVDVNVSPSTAP
jgi:hypothetical protein